MSLEVTKQEQLESSDLLTLDQEKEVVRKCNELWTLGENALQKPRKRKERIVKAYECQHEDVILKRNGSKAYLPWIYIAHEAAQARLSNSLLPNDEDVFALVGETEDDQAGCDMMAEYMKAKLNAMGFNSVFDDFIKEVLFGEAVLKVYWKKDVKTRTDRGFQQSLDELGNPIQTLEPQQVEEIIYNSIYTEVISSNDFILYPLSGDMSRASCAHRVWRFKDDLLAAQEEGEYTNVDRIEDGKKDFEGKDDGKSGQQGLEVKEFWLNRIIVDGKVYRNMIATIVDGKHLIRFKSNEYDYGLIPFVYCPLVKNYTKNGLQNSGHGLTDRAYEIQKTANFTLNQMLDESKVKLYGCYKYVDDGVFNPASFVSRPGGLIKVQQINNLEPLNPNVGQLSFGITELQYLENQFEVVTGIPKFLKGIQDESPGKETATAKRLAAEGADSRFRALAKRINENGLKPLMMMFYTLIRQYAMTDIEVLMDIARVTQRSRVDVVDPLTQQVTKVELTPEQLIQQLPVIPPLSKVDINIVGFENVLSKADKANQIERFMSGVANLAGVDPSVVKRIKMDQAVDYYARNLSIDSDILRDEAEMRQLQQEEMAMQQQKQQRIMEMAGRLNVDPRQVEDLLNAA